MLDHELAGGRTDGNHEVGLPCRHASAQELDERPFEVWLPVARHVQ
jgi:hypothetical protein